MATTVLAVLVVIVTTVGNVIAQVILAKRTESNVDQQLAHAASEAEKVREHEKDLRVAEEEGSARANLNQARKSAYLRYLEASTALGNAADWSAVTTGGVPDDFFSQWESRLRDVREASWPVMLLGNAEVQSAAQHLLRYLEGHYGQHLEREELLAAQLGFSEAAQRELT